MKILLVTYSRTGASARLAAVAQERLQRSGVHTRSVTIRPRWDLPYPLWLALSFVPRLGVPVDCPVPYPEAADACLLCSPKWTLACPPLNGFLRVWSNRLPPTAFLLTCGGWDQRRYLHDLIHYAEHLGVTVRGGMWVRRRAVETEAVREALGCFLTDRLL